MATKGQKKTTYETSQEFLDYQEEIVNHPVYQGMPDLKFPDGSIQWEAPSNRTSGMFKDSHKKRLEWWKKKAEEIGISTTENMWISKTAKTIHPTGMKPCKYCGKVMDIRYCYLSSNFIKRVQKLDYVDEKITLEYTTSILDFVPNFIDLYGDKGYNDLPKLLKCKQFPVIKGVKNSIQDWIEWINNKYIPAEPSMLGPGAMANPPDRLDGFHSFNRCCRSSVDKGRTKENLRTYSTDRRAFENWVGGNWIKANKLMGIIGTDADIKKLKCLNDGDGNPHPRPCSADHIGPISLGFSHRPEFQLLCSSCNSAKNNRMYFTDVEHLRNQALEGIEICTWYSKPIWDIVSPKVVDTATSLRLSRILRDNRHFAMILLGRYLEKKQYLFLLSLLNLSYADYEYTLNNISINNCIVTADFEKHKSELVYVLTRKTRKVRVSFESLVDYLKKENRNGFLMHVSEVDAVINKTLKLLSAQNDYWKGFNQNLTSILEKPDYEDSELSSFLNGLPYEELLSEPNIVSAKEHLVQTMTLYAKKLAELWDDSRYSRD